MTLADRLDGVTDDADALFDLFLDWVTSRGIELYEAQEEAVLEILTGRHVILSTPTGSGKSLVAVASHLYALVQGARSFYTSPIKALVSEKFFDLCEIFGPERVGMMTGDSSVNRDAPIVCCTAEILANMALRDGEDADVGYVVMDEFHYYSDRDRGVAWQVPLITLPRATFLLMSATLGDTSEIERRLSEMTAREVATVTSATRPVPLDYHYRETPLHETVSDVVEGGMAPVYQVNFTQRECAEQAQNLMSTDYCTKDEKRAISEALRGFRFDTPYGKEMRRFLRHGVGLHHGGLLPKYRLLVERLARKGLLKVICGTDTLGVGVNVPIRTVLFTRLCKFDGQKVGLLSVRDFKQISGRAGRKGYDDRGYVICQAPEHVIENKRLESKARSAAGSGKKKKFRRAQPPKKGYVPWNEQTFRGLIERPPETLTPSFSVDHGMMLNLLQRDGNPHRRGGGYGLLIDLISRSHEPEAQQRRLRRQSRGLVRALIGAGIVEVHPAEWGRGQALSVSDALQEEFSLHQTLSLFLVEALAALDPASPDYALDVLSLTESILENPRVVLYKQVDRLKGDLVQELKAQGVPYEERMEKLDDITYPKPRAQLIYTLFDAFAGAHPWLTDSHIRPKSILRDIYERYMPFNDYVKELGLERSEGVLLRYLSQGFKVLVQTVPEVFRDDAVHDMIAFFRALLGRVDSSLLQEWERLLHAGDGVDDAADPVPLDITRDPKRFHARIRAELHALVQALSRHRWDEAAELVAQDPDDRWEGARFEAAMAGFFEEHERLVFDHTARWSDKTTIVPDGASCWIVTQTLVDPDGDNLWAIHGRLDLREDKAPLGPMVLLDRIGM